MNAERGCGAIMSTMAKDTPTLAAAPPASPAPTGQSAVWKTLLDAGKMKLSVAEIVELSKAGTTSVRRYLVAMKANGHVQAIEQARPDQSPVMVWWLTPAGRTNAKTVLKPPKPVKAAKAVAKAPTAKKAAARGR